MIFFSEENQGLTAMDPSLKRKRLDQDQSEMHQSKKRKVEPWTVEWAWNGVVNVIKSTLGYPTDENSDPNQNLPMVVEQAPPVTPTRSPFRTVIQRNGPPPKLQEMQTRRGEKEYKKFEAWMRSKYEKKSDSDGTSFVFLVFVSVVFISSFPFFSGFCFLLLVLTILSNFPFLNIFFSHLFLQKLKFLKINLLHKKVD